jgi:hypothetical protein
MMILNCGHPRKLVLSLVCLDVKHCIIEECEHPLAFVTLAKNYHNHTKFKEIACVQTRISSVNSTTGETRSVTNVFWYLVLRHWHLNQIAHGINPSGMRGRSSGKSLIRAAKGVFNSTRDDSTSALMRLDMEFSGGELLSWLRQSSLDSAAFGG